MISGKVELSTLFSPARINTMELKNRIVMPAMGTLFALADGSVSKRLCRYYEARAKGGAALITVEVTEVHPSSASRIGNRGVCSIYDDKFIPGWKQFTDLIHVAGAKASLQLHHPGRQIVRLGPNRPPWAPSVLPCPCPFCHDVPHEMNVEEIEEMVQSFGEGAKRAKRAGFDAVEIHGAHGYLVAQFMSHYSNRRTDKYGGDFLSRMRFALEIVHTVREKVGPDFPIIFRFSANEGVRGGRTVVESVAMAPLLVSAGVDCLSVSTGVYANIQTHVVAPGAMEKGLNVDAAKAIKEVVDVPIIAVGKLNDPMIANQVILIGKADLVAIGRGILADPDLPNKVAAGHFEDIRWCLGCNQCIHSMLTKYSMTCTVNPEVGRESEMTITPTPKSKNVLVVGGGPAGMEVARVAALRGHKVALYEKENILGGQFLLASMAPGKQDISIFLKYLSRQVEKAGAKVITGEVVTCSLVEKVKPDTVVLATGGKSVIPDIPGINVDKVTTAQDVLACKITTGKKVLIAGGGRLGCEVAHFLTEFGKEITLVEKSDIIAGDLAYGPMQLLTKQLIELGVKIITLATIKRIADNHVIIDRNGCEEIIHDVDHVVLALGVEPVRDLEDDLRGKVTEIHVIGDAETPANALKAISAGAAVGRQI